MVRIRARVVRYATPPAAYALATVLVWFAAAKLFHLQFAIPPRVFDTPVGQLKSQELMWTFFGWSPVYETLLGWTELVGAFLVMLPATRFAGGLLLLPVLCNIVVLDVLFEVGAVQIASLLLVLVLIIVIPQAHRLKALFNGTLSYWQLLANVVLIVVIVSAVRFSQRE